MGLGAIPPTEIVFAARLEAEANTEKMDKNAAMPQDNFLKPEWQHKPFRNYTVYYNADLHRVRFSRTPDGMRHGSIEFVAVVYTGDGETVNSIMKTDDPRPDRRVDTVSCSFSGLQKNEGDRRFLRRATSFCASACTTRRATRWARSRFPSIRSSWMCWAQRRKRADPAAIGKSSNPVHA